MLKYLKKYWFFCILAPLFMVAEVAMDLLQPALMADIVDNGVMKSDISLIIRVGMKMILTVMAGGAGGILCGIFANLAAQGFGNDLRKDVFAKIMSLSFQQTDKISTGSLVTRLTNDVTQVQNMVMMAVRGFVRNSVMFLGGIIMLYRQSDKFAMIAACGLPFIILFVMFFLKKASPMFAIVQKKLDGINNMMQETVAGARVVKAYVREEYELNRFDIANGDLCRENLKVQSLLAFLSPCMNIVLNICVVMVIVIGGLTVRAGGDVSPGNIMAAITYLAQILHGITFMANIFQTFSRAKASAERIREVLDCHEIIVDGAGVCHPYETKKEDSEFHKGETDIGRPAKNGRENNEKEKSARNICTSPIEERGCVEFKNVSFAYPDSEGEYVLEDISFKVKPGETFAIIGATGSGKSSLIHLIPRFYDVTKGEVLVNGINVKEYRLRDLRDKIAVVLQKAELYVGSIEENIRWSKKEAGLEEIKEAAMIAQADEFITKTPEGYHTQVSEGGRSLSGGQKQRISIARAILKEKEIMIFDDSTSALDLKTEAALYQALQKEDSGITKIIIAQRIASIQAADRILVLENGRISAIGTHEELRESSEVYRDIYLSQLKSDEEEREENERN